MDSQDVLCVAEKLKTAALIIVTALMLLAPSSLHAQDEPSTYTGRLAFVWGDLVTNDKIQASIMSAQLLTEAGETIPLESLLSCCLPAAWRRCRGLRLRSKARSTRPEPYRCRR